MDGGLSHIKCGKSNFIFVFSNNNIEKKNCLWKVSILYCGPEIDVSVWKINKKKNKLNCYMIGFHCFIPCQHRTRMFSSRLARYRAEPESTVTAPTCWLLMGSFSLHLRLFIFSFRPRFSLFAAFHPVIFTTLARRICTGILWGQRD